jgi:DNA-binding winged helix-turn-helix (wHTH) protein
MMIVRFGDFTLDDGTRQIRRTGAPVRIEPKAFELLALLLRERPRALAKDEIHDHLWPDAVVSESHLSSLVAEVRRALDDDPRQPAFIRTVHGFGYAFCGAAVEVDRVLLPRLRLVADDREYVLSDGVNLLGRSADALVCIDEPTVSRHHARIVVVEGRATLEDLDSKNGTRLGGVPVAQPMPLSDGDEIGVGSATFVFRILRAEETRTAP